MTINEFLAEQGLTAEEITAVVGNEKQAKAMSAALDKFSAGSEALTKAQSEKTETEKYWADKTSELQNGVNRLTAAEKRAAKAEAEAAKSNTYLKSLKSMNYEVPDDVVADVTEKKAEPQYMTREDWEKQARSWASNVTTAMDLSNEYLHLFGKPYTSSNADLLEASKAGKNLTEFVHAKYGFEAERKKKDDAVAEERYQTRHKAELDAEQKKWQEAHGSNPNTASPRPSMFDRLQKQNNADGKTVLSAEARNKNKESRKERYANMSVHVN